MDRDIKSGQWARYLKKYKDKYLLNRDELGIWQIRLKQNLGYIQPYSIEKKQLVAILNFKSQQHKTFFKKRLIGNEGSVVKIMQEGIDELCLVFDEKNIKLLETLLKIRKKYKITQKQRKKLVERLKKAREIKNGGQL